MPRSKRYLELAGKIKADQLYSLEEALKLVKETSTTKFPGSIELHVRLGINKEKSDQQVRSTVTLPHGTGKTAKVAVFAVGPAAQEAKDAGADLVGGEELIAEIQKTGKINFEVAVATPDMMKNLAKIAKILGPKGLMPSPKNETITNEVKKAVNELKKGKIAFKNDATGNIHLQIGKADFADDKLQENIETVMEAIKKARPQGIKGTYIKTVSLNATMGPGVRVSLL